jgi:hypothetical protein
MSEISEVKEAAEQEESDDEEVINNAEVLQHKFLNAVCHYYIKLSWRVPT